MRFLASLFFLFLMPIVVFLGTILYGGLSGTALKSELARTNIYETITTKLKDVLSQSDEGSDPTMTRIMAIADKKLSPGYVQGKAEMFIDDAGNWITGQTEVKPVISFKDIKDDLIAQNPKLLPSLEKTIAEMRKQAEEAKASGAGEGAPDMAALDKQIGGLESLIKSDFTISMDKSLVGPKASYGLIKIAFPVLSGLAILCLLSIILLSKTLSSKLRWLGVLVVLSGAWGLVLVQISNVFLGLGEQILLSADNEVAKTVSPIVTQLLALFVNQFKMYQTKVSIAFICGGIICIILSLVLKSSSATPAMAVAKARTKK